MANQDTSGGPYRRGPRRSLSDRTVIVCQRCPCGADLVVFSSPPGQPGQEREDHAFPCLSCGRELLAQGIPEMVGFEVHLLGRVPLSVARPAYIAFVQSRRWGSAPPAPRRYWLRAQVTPAAFALAVAVGAFLAWALSAKAGRWMDPP